MKPSRIPESEPLINCWIREGGEIAPMKKGWLRIPLFAPEAAGSFLEVFYAYRTLLGDLRLSRAVQWSAQPGEELSTAKLAELLVAELHAKNLDSTPSLAAPDWKENLDGSVAVMQAIFSNPRSRAGDSSPTPFDFIASEQSLFHGHRFHPSPKSRLGFDANDLERYSPEWGARFRLHYIAVRDDFAKIRGEFPLWTRFSRAILGSAQSETHALLPLHPWQARKLAMTPEFRQWLETGQVIDLGAQGPEFYATSSVRTLYQPDHDFFIKTSLEVRITNCFRRNLPGEMDAIQTLSPILRAHKPGSAQLRVLEEPMSVDVLEGSSPLALGAILREGLATEREEDLEPLLTGALFGERDLGTERLRRLIPHGAETEWFRAYCRGLVLPMLDAFFRQGIMFEPHLQNVLVCLRQGRPVRWILRDLDNVKLIEGSAAARLLGESPRQEDMTYPEEYAWRRLVYCLFVNHLSEAIASIARIAHTPEQALWSALREVLLDRATEFPRVAQLLKQPSLWAKKNLFTRITRTPDKDAPFAEIPNPLKQQ